MQIAGVSVSTFNGVREEFALHTTQLICWPNTKLEKIQSIGIPAKLND